MVIQNYIALGLLALAVVYTMMRFKKNWQQGDTDPKCDDCEIPELMKKNKQL